jgi:hypothetical protein
MSQQQHFPSQLHNFLAKSCLPSTALFLLNYIFKLCLFVSIILFQLQNKLSIKSKTYIWCNPISLVHVGQILTSSFYVRLRVFQLTRIQLRALQSRAVQLSKLQTFSSYKDATEADSVERDRQGYNWELCNWQRWNWNASYQLHHMHS